VDADPLGNRLVDRVPGVQRARWVLEDHLHPTPQLAQRPRPPGHRRAVEHDGAGRHPLEAEDRSDQRRLAAPRLADQRQHLATAHVEIDAVDSVHEPAAGREVDLRVADLEERAAGPRRPGRRQVSDRGARHRRSQRSDLTF
jgi:hypothetical protein